MPCGVAMVKKVIGYVNNSGKYNEKGGKGKFGQCFIKIQNNELFYGQ